MWRSEPSGIAQLQVMRLFSFPTRTASARLNFPSIAAITTASLCCGRLVRLDTDVHHPHVHQNQHRSVLVAHCRQQESPHGNVRAYRMPGILYDYLRLLVSGCLSAVEGILECGNGGCMHERQCFREYCDCPRRYAAAIRAGISTKADRDRQFSPSSQI